MYVMIIVSNANYRYTIVINTSGTEISVARADAVIILLSLVYCLNSMARLLKLITSDTWYGCLNLLRLTLGTVA